MATDDQIMDFKMSFHSYGLKGRILVFNNYFNECLQEIDSFLRYFNLRVTKYLALSMSNWFLAE